MLSHPEQCIDKRGVNYVKEIFEVIAMAMGVKSPKDAIATLREMMNELALANPESTSREQEISLLTTSVNPVRLKNNPVAIDTATARALYEIMIR